MKYMLLALILILTITQTFTVLASPVISIDESVNESLFYSKSYTNPDSMEAHQIGIYSEDGEHSQIHCTIHLSQEQL